MNVAILKVHPAFKKKIKLMATNNDKSILEFTKLIAQDEYDGQFQNIKGWKKNQNEYKFKF